MAVAALPLIFKTDAAGIVPDEMFEALRLVRPEPVPEMMPDAVIDVTPVKAPVIIAVPLND